MPSKPGGSKSKVANSKKGANSKVGNNTRKNTRLKFLTQQEIANMETMKREFHERMDALKGTIHQFIQEIIHLNKVIYAINKIKTILKGVNTKEALEAAGAELKAAGPAPEQTKTEWESLSNSLIAQKNTDISIHVEGEATLYSILNNKFSLETALHPIKVDAKGRLPVKNPKVNPANVAVREILFHDVEKGFELSRECSVKRRHETTDLSEWRGTDQLKMQHKYKIDSKLLFGKDQNWSVAPGSWKNVPNSFKANLAAKTMFQPGSVVVVPYKGDATHIVGVFREYNEAELRKADDLKFCLKAHWIQSGLLYDENPEKGWDLPEGWTGPRLIPYIEPLP